jgi:hypothetical protein
MRDLKYGSASDAAVRAVAEALREAGRRAEALLLFERRSDPGFLAEERDWALREGNAFHLLSVRRLGGPVEDEHLRRCATAAEQRGRWMDARNCWLALGEETDLARIAEHLPAALRPPEPDAGEA